MFNAIRSNDSSLLADQAGENILTEDGVPECVISSEFMAKTPHKLALNLLVTRST